MERATHICTHCGYEGRPVKPPSDDAYEGQSEASKAIGRVANLIFPGLGLLIRPLALFLLLPVYLLLWLLRPFVKKKKHCPNCGLPLMVKLRSDAGYVAQRQQAVRAGLADYKTEAAPTTSFGGKIVLPGDEKKQQKAPPPKPERLPSLEVMLQEEPTQTEVSPAESEQPLRPPKKPVDPDQW